MPSLGCGPLRAFLPRPFRPRPPQQPTTEGGDGETKPNQGPTDGSRPEPQRPRNRPYFQRRQQPPPGPRQPTVPETSTPSTVGTTPINSGDNPLPCWSDSNSKDTQPPSGEWLPFSGKVAKAGGLGRDDKLLPFMLSFFLRYLPVFPTDLYPPQHPSLFPRLHDMETSAFPAFPGDSGEPSPSLVHPPPAPAPL